MLSVTALLGRPSRSDGLRYGRGGDPPPAAEERRPVVVWNCTRRCNLRCRHCYSDSDSRRHPEMSDEQARAMLRDIADFGAPALLLSGGEPLIRPGVLDLVGEARDLGLAVTLSTNGTILSSGIARRLADLGVRYAGISLDGIGHVHDAYRGRRGAFERALGGVRALRDVGVTAGMRVTLSPAGIAALPDLFRLAEREGVGRICLYHLVPAGRGAGEPPGGHGPVRAALATIFAQAEKWIEEDRPIEVLTVDNYADGPALHRWLTARGHPRADTVADALRWNGGARNAAGRGLAAIDWLGRVRPDQFWPGEPVGDVRERPLSRIWTDPAPRLRALRRRSERIGGRCGRCRYRDMCGGGLASRALAATGDILAPDPACHLTDREIGISSAPSHTT